MYKALNPSAIGVQATTLPSAIAAAQQGGFEGVEFNVREVADLVDQHGAEYVKGLFAEANLKPAAVVGQNTRDWCEALDVQTIILVE